MAGTLTRGPGSLFDFGPVAHLYEDWYSTPEGQAHDQVQQKDVDALLPPARERQILLEVGCGTGHWSRYFHGLGYSVKGIDVSHEMITVAREISPECRFDVADASDLPFEDGSFDVTASITALEFFPDPGTAVKEMARCTRQGGIMLIGTLNRIAPINRKRLKKEEQPFASGNLLGPGELLDLISPFGEVRMVASGVPGPVQAPTLIPAGQGPKELENLKGPLLAAQVKRV